MAFSLVTIISLSGVVIAVAAIIHDTKKKKKAQQDWEYFQKNGELKSKHRLFKR